jgi:hypothetical protein
MKRPLLFVFASLVTANSFAQYSRGSITLEKPGVGGDSIIRNKTIFLKSRPDTGIDKNILPYNGMPNAIRRKNPPDVYVGNNGQGQDIYRSQIDNMAILKPDSSFYSGMPNGSGSAVLDLLKNQGTSPVMPKRIYTVPKGNKSPQ